MELTKAQLIENALREAKDFSKDVRKYIHETSKDRPLTKEEQKLWELTCDVHVHTNDAILLLESIDDLK